MPPLFSSATASYQFLAAVPRLCRQACRVFCMCFCRSCGAQGALHASCSSCKHSVSQSWISAIPPFRHLASPSSQFSVAVWVAAGSHVCHQMSCARRCLLCALATQSELCCVCCLACLFSTRSRHSHHRVFLHGCQQYCSTRVPRLPSAHTDRGLAAVHLLASPAPSLLVLASRLCFQGRACCGTARATLSKVSWLWLLLLSHCSYLHLDSVLKGVCYCTARATLSVGLVAVACLLSLSLLALASRCQFMVARITVASRMSLFALDATCGLGSVALLALSHCSHLHLDADSWWLASQTQRAFH